MRARNQYRDMQYNRRRGRDLRSGDRGIGLRCDRPAAVGGQRTHSPPGKISGLPDDRYLQLVNLLQEMARRLVTFGLHVPSASIPATKP